ncbi:MAG: hypothetical protein M1836_004810 [Candelina mexicana]|nr:MAG: hypothetical protein M1836_004810 [Candelina mexicana]
MRACVHPTIRITTSVYRRLDVLPVPVFLCPVLQYANASRNVTTGLSTSTSEKAFARKQKSQQYSSTAAVEPADVDSFLPRFKNGVPFSCPGCGALTQTADSNGAGFYSKARRSLKASAHEKAKDHEGEKARQVYEAALANVEGDVLKQLGLSASSVEVPKQNVSSQIPVCDRCHDLLHHHKGVPIDHPTLESIQDTMSESPHDYNHVYHVLDAADFPMSLIPRLHQHLSLTPQRSQNRRSKTEKYYHGTKAELTFIVTRSDLLAPKKEQVDSMMPYLVEVLRDALGSVGKDIRLGNVKCVSAKRGWWTRELKKDIWKRGGGGWMVGKVNVGKSSLFECVFPKGGTNENKIGASQTIEHQAEQNQYGYGDSSEIGSLLPPAQPETAFPVLPITSSIPGTTASPIRLPFGNGKGELIDLPGLHRGRLASYIELKRQGELVMRHRVDPKQHVFKPGQSLLLGGLIRFTPTAPEHALAGMGNIFIIAHTFVPLPQHITSVDKATKIQAQLLHSANSILKPGAGKHIQSAGRFQLKWEVTKQFTGPLTSKSAAKLNAERLPFRIFSTDILIEGCGWVELTAQVSKTKLEELSQASIDSGSSTVWYPEVEIFSPEGKYVSFRKPMNAWLFAAKKKKIAKGRPRPSMKGAKRREKARKGKDQSETPDRELIPPA